MDAKEPLYLGLDLSTQQIKAIIIDSRLHARFTARVEFDHDLPHYQTTNGVLINHDTHEVKAPVAMWLEAIDLLLSRLTAQEVPFASIRATSGAGQQHGSIFWGTRSEQALQHMSPEGSLADQLASTLACPTSPNWQDASTQVDCEALEQTLGGADKLAEVTGSSAHHRFTGPQIRKIRRMQPRVYQDTWRISLVSSFLASVLCGSIMPIDISDACGMNMWDVRRAKWHTGLLASIAGDYTSQDLVEKLGSVRSKETRHMPIATYFQVKYGFSPQCHISSFTGDNPSTILSLGLRPDDAIISLGTSTTFLMSTPHYKPDPAYHMFNHPTTEGLYMFMLCYKNGALARREVADRAAAASPGTVDDIWAVFNQIALQSPILGQHKASDPAKLGLYFPLPEIVPKLPPGTWRYDAALQTFSEENTTPTLIPTTWSTEEDVRTILESQALSMRLRSQRLMRAQPSLTSSASTLGSALPPQPRRIYLVGGGSVNPAIARVVGDVVGGAEGVWRLDERIGGNACALGAAQRALWTIEGGGGGGHVGLLVESHGGGEEAPQGPGTVAAPVMFEAFLAERWSTRGGMDDALVKVDEGYKAGVWERYGRVLDAFADMEREVAGRME